MEKQLVIIQNEQPVTTSLMVAETYGKKHQHVLRSIRELIGETKNGLTDMFELSTYEDVQGKTRPMYFMNRDGYTLLVMGFTGKDALQFKLKYMEAFNQMENHIKSSQLAVQAPKTSLQVLQATINQMVEIEAKQLEMDCKVNAIAEKVKMIEEERTLNGEALLSVPLSEEAVPELTMRAKINQLARQYGSATNTPMADVWHKIYGDLYYIYHIQLGGKNKLDEAERRGVLEPIYNVISDLVRKFKAL